MLTPTMKPGLAAFFQAVIVILGLAILAFLLGEPHLEGRNAHATLFEVYFKDPFLAYVYVGSTPFFVALYRAFGLFGEVRRFGIFSPASVATLRTIQRCAFILMGFVAGGVIIILVNGDPQDRPAGVFMSLLVTLGAGTLATVAALAARSLQAAPRPSEGARS